MGVSVVETIVLCRPRILWPSVNGCRCTCCPELPPWLSNFRPPPPCGCGVFWRFFLSVQASWSRYHATFPSFALLHGPMHSNPPYTVSLYHLFRLLWIIQKNIFHIRTLSLLLLHFLSLYLPNHSPPPFYQWCDGPHCGVVVILQYKLSFPDAPQKDVSFSAHASVWVCSYLDSFSTLQRELKKNSIFCPKP